MCLIYRFLVKRNLLLCHPFHCCFTLSFSPDGRAGTSTSTSTDNTIADTVVTDVRCYVTQDTSKKIMKEIPLLIAKLAVSALLFMCMIFRKSKHKMFLRKISWNFCCGKDIGFKCLGWRSFSSSNLATVDVATKEGELRVFIVAGEVSGDMIASRVMHSLQNLSPFPVRFAGVGGSMMSSRGLSSIFPIEDISVMGIWELLPHLKNFTVKLKQTVLAALSFRPHVVLTVDSKGFSFRFLKQLRARCVQQGIVAPQHFHYVAPSFWAWKGGEERLRGLSEFVDHVLCILPFEAEVCKANGIAATFVGHPTLEDIIESKEKIPGSPTEIQGNGEKFKTEYGISSGSTIISLLPGSRLQEVARMLPIFYRTMERLRDSFGELMNVVHVAPNRHVADYISKSISAWPVPVLLIPGGSSCKKYNSFNASKVALCTSGTVAVELQLARLPCVVAYRAHLLTEWIIRYKAKVPYISIPNILLDSPIIPEALFDKCTPSKLAPLLIELIHNEYLRERQISAAGKVIELLSPHQGIIDNSMQLAVDLTYPDSPSRIAASAILFSKRILA